MNKKAFIILAILAGGYYLYTNRENFALTSGSVVDVSQTDPTKFYYVGKRTKSNTLTQSQNGGTNCSEFPETVYQLAPVVNATCSVPDITSGNIDGNYSFSTTAIKGNVLYPRFFSLSQSSSPATAKFIDIAGSSALLVDGSDSVYYTTQMNSLSPSWVLLNSGFLSQVSLNKDGFKLGSDGAGKIWASYPFTTNNWAAESSNGFANMYEVGNSVTTTPTNPIKFALTVASGILNVGVHGITGWVNMTSLLISNISVDGFFVSAIGKNDGKLYYIDGVNKNYSNGTLTQFMWTAVPGSEQIGGTGLAFISAGADYKALGIDKNGNLWKCNNIKTAQSASDWKIIMSNPSTVKFRNVSYKAGNTVIAAVGTDNKLYIESDLTALFNL
jgi:hypothetical protein